MNKVVPIYILTGYLGTGKTTLLKNMLTQLAQEGTRAAVLMNEFGSVSVDTLLLQDSGVPVFDLLDGCVCCSLKGSLAEGIMTLLSDHQPDVILLETTGVASPIDLVEAVLEPDLKSRVKLSGVITLVSATRFPIDLPAFNTLGINEKTMAEQVQYADLILLTKGDLVEPFRLEAVEAAVRNLNAQAPLRHVLHGALELEEWRDARAKNQSAKVLSKPKGIARRKFGNTKAVPSVREKVTSFGQLEAFAHTLTHPLDSDRVYEFLYGLGDTVLRAKGFYVDAESGLLHEFHYTPRTPMTAIVFGMENPKTFALFIGEGLDQQALVVGVSACEVVQER